MTPAFGRLGLTNRPVGEFNHGASMLMKKAIIPVGVLVILGSLGLWFYGRPAYKHYQETRSIEQARKFMARGDYRNASLSARQTLQVNPRNLDACRIIAELAEMSRSPHVLDWRRRTAAL